MLFNTAVFAYFLIIVFVLYWFVFNKKLSLQNSLLLVASYVFYGCWDWRFLFLLLFSTLLDFFTGTQMEKHPERKKFYFWLSVIINVGFLGVFKYFNFFADSFAEAVSHFGITVSPWTLNVILPVGISFYTFHGLSYVIDVYKGRIKAEKNFIDYSLFVSFFPLLVAGPIERATHLLPQIKEKRYFDYNRGIDGLRQIIWGLFKKVVIADQCAVFANDIFKNYESYPGSTLLIGGVFFAFQIYGDFSGYSDIALGTARLFGIELLRNFAFPYFSRDISEFWRRWHISLSSWFKDYLYIPLGGSRGSMWIKVRNTFIIFIVSGFWHGANWTFIIWGLLNALYIMPQIVRGTNRNYLEIAAKGRVLPSIKEVFQIGVTFGLTVIAWIFFRSNTVGQAWTMVRKIFSPSIVSLPYFNNGTLAIPVILITGIFVIIEWLGRENKYAIEKIEFNVPKVMRWAFYYLLIFAVMYYSDSEQSFIYFQF